MNRLADVVKRKMISMNQSRVIFRVFHEVEKTDLENILVVRLFLKKVIKYLYILKRKQMQTETTR